MPGEASAVRLAWASVPDPGEERRATARRLVRELLAREGWPGARLDARCPRCGAADHGPLRVNGAPWRASVSYAGPIAVAAVHPDTVVSFAIDAELLDDPVRTAAGGVPGGLLRWVRVEAALKADGRGLRVAHEGVHIAERPGGYDGVGAWTAHIPGAPDVTGGWEAGGVPGVLVAVAVRAGGQADAARGAGSGGS